MSTGSKSETKIEEIPMDTNIDAADLSSLVESAKKIDSGKINQDLKKDGISGITIEPKAIESAINSSATSVAEIGNNLINEVARQSEDKKPATAISEIKAANLDQGKAKEGASKD